MFSTEQRRVAIETFIRFDHSYADTIAELGYPTRTCLRNWWKEYESTGEIPVGKGRHRKSRHTDGQARAAVGYYLEHGKSLSRTMRALGHRLYLLLNRDRARLRVRPPAFPLPGGELVDPIAEALPTGGMAHPAHDPGEAPPMCEVAVHGGPPHLQGGLGLPLPLRGPDLPVLQIVPVPGPERLPRRVAELGNGVCRAQVELDVGLGCQLALPCAVHAVLRVTFSWSRITTAVPQCSFYATKSSSLLRLGAKYADVVLPVNTKWETTASCLYSGTMIASDKENVFTWRQVIGPLYDTKDDREIAIEIGRRLGLSEDQLAELYPKTEKQLWFEQMTQASVFKDGAYVPIATVTQEDIDRYGVDYEPQEGLIPFEQLIDEGVYRVVREEDGSSCPGGIAYQAFIDDPDVYALTSRSGKFEIYCQQLSDWYDMVNGYADGDEGILDYVRVSPLPKYLEHPFSHEEAKKSKHPFQVTHNHCPRRAHTDCDNVPWVREVFQNPIFINKQDAEAKGIKQGDIILMHNDYGQFLRPATVSRCVMPGCVIMPHGATARIDEKIGIDLFGADNMLTASNRTTTPFLNSWNSILVDYEKYDGPIDLPADYLAEPIVPKFAEEMEA